MQMASRKWPFGSRGFYRSMPLTGAPPRGDYYTNWEPCFFLALTTMSIIVANLQQWEIMSWHDMRCQQACKNVWQAFYTPVLRRAILCDWVWRVGGERPHRLPHNNFSSVYRIFTKLGHMIPLWKGKNPIYFGVKEGLTSKIRNCLNTPNWPRKKIGIVRMTSEKNSELSELTSEKNSEFRIKVGNYHPYSENIVRFRKLFQASSEKISALALPFWCNFWTSFGKKFRNSFWKIFRTISGKNPQTTFVKKFQNYIWTKILYNFFIHKFP